MIIIVILRVDVRSNYGLLHPDIARDLVQKAVIIFSVDVRLVTLLSQYWSPQCTTVFPQY